MTSTLESCKNAEELLSYLKPSKTKIRYNIGENGGRSFAIGKETVNMKQIVQQMFKSCEDNLINDKETVKNVLRRVNKVNAKSKKLITKSSLWVRLLTYIRGLFDFYNKEKNIEILRKSYKISKMEVIPTGFSKQLIELSAHYFKKFKPAAKKIFQETDYFSKKILPFKSLPSEKRRISVENEDRRYAKIINEIEQDKNVEKYFKKFKQVQNHFQYSSSKERHRIIKQHFRNNHAMGLHVLLISMGNHIKDSYQLQRILLSGKCTKKEKEVFMTLESYDLNYA